MKISPRLLMGRGITHLWGWRQCWHPSWTARAVEPAALLTGSAEHLKNPSAAAPGLLPAAESAPAFPPEDGNWLLSMEPAVPWRPGQPNPAPSHPLSSRWCKVWGRWGTGGAGGRLDALSWTCWLLTRHSPSHPAPSQAPWCSDEQDQGDFSMETRPRANQVTKRWWKCGRPLKSSNEHRDLLHACLHAMGSGLTLKHWLEEDSTYYTSLSCPSWKATQLLLSCSQFVPPAAAGWCTHGNPRLEGISRNISSRIVLLRHWKMFIKSLCNSHQWWRAQHLPGVGSRQELLFPAANPGWSWQHTGTLKHLVCEYQNRPRPPCDSMIWSVIGLWA